LQVFFLYCVQNESISQLTGDVKNLSNLKCNDSTLLNAPKVQHRFACIKRKKQHKKVQSQRFALQELLKQFLLMYRYCTSNFLFHKKGDCFRFFIKAATTCILPPALLKILHR